ncbi:unnamed protein product [Ostreobium quekettii]|uniref:Suppressor of white apricot N-terminal domain-containing protein n=1 Tax=Ostreobium quekettii TaxID=121088 RepID=A0A8S1J4H5_9CHLO|nr:unnamed protein product [Ostreobium quekettii]
MANYYHEARAHVRRLKEMSEENKRRAERRAELASAQAEHPINFLMGEGHSCKIHRSTEQYNAIERQEGMIAWNDHQDNMIDRFDGRALLDFYREPSTSRRQEKAPEEVELEKWVAFESYRDLVRLLSRGISESEGLAFVEHENIEIRAKAKVAAAAAVSGAQGEQAALATASNISSGLAGYAVFGYDLDDGSSSDNDSDEQHEGDEGDDEDSQEEGEGRGAQVLDRDELDRVGEEQFGIEHFSSRLKRVLKFEGDADAFRFKAAGRRRISRKKYAERAKRMAGQGLDPHGHPSDWKDLPNQPLREGRSGATHRRGSHRASPDYHSQARHRHYSSSRSRSSSGGRSRSRSPRAHGQRGRTEYITEFRGETAHHSRHGGWVDESAAETRHPATRSDPFHIFCSRQQEKLHCRGCSTPGYRIGGVPKLEIDCMGKLLHWACSVLLGCVKKR